MSSTLTTFRNWLVSNDPFQTFEYFGLFGAFVAVMIKGDMNNKFSTVYVALLLYFIVGFFGNMCCGAIILLIDYGISSRFIMIIKFLVAVLIGFIVKNFIGQWNSNEPRKSE